MSGLTATERGQRAIAIKAYADKISILISDGEAFLKDNAIIAEAAHGALTWSGKRILLGDRPFVECKLAERAKHVGDIKGLMDRAIAATEELLGIAKPEMRP